MKALQSWRGRLQAVALATVAVGMVAVGNAAARQEGPRGPDRGGPGMRGPRPFAQLNLSDEQRTKVRAIVQKHRDADRSTMEQLRAARQSLRAAIFSSSTPDTAELEQLTSQIADLQAQLLKARTAAQLEVASVLTVEQRQKMASLPQRRPGRRPQR